MENNKFGNELNAEQLQNISGGSTFGVPMRSLGRFIIQEDRSLGVNDAAVPSGYDLMIGDLICVCPETGEAKDVVRIDERKPVRGLPVILVGTFLSESVYGKVQFVNARDYS